MNERETVRNESFEPESVELKEKSEMPVRKIRKRAGQPVKKLYKPNLEIAKQD